MRKLLALSAALLLLAACTSSNGGGGGTGGNGSTAGGASGATPATGGASGGTSATGGSGSTNVAPELEAAACAIPHDQLLRVWRGTDLERSGQIVFVPQEPNFVGSNFPR